MVRQKKNVEESVIEREVEPVAVEKATVEDRLRPIVGEIKKCDGVIGYILKNTESATIDLDDPTKLADYATLSSLTFEATEKLSELFELGRVRVVKVEGNDTKVLQLRIDENDVSFFLEKSVDTRKILQKMNAP